MTPYSNGMFMPGVEIHANAYETIARANFLVDAPLWAVATVALALAIFAGNRIRFRTPACEQTLSARPPSLPLRRSLPSLSRAPSSGPGFPERSPQSSLHRSRPRGVISSFAGSSLPRAQETNRYQNAMQFVIHEMRTPLTAIQGSSELISRYSAMPEEKRKQMADLINIRIETAGPHHRNLSQRRTPLGRAEMEMRSRSAFPSIELVESCAVRARALAERKKIEIEIAPLPSVNLSGDRELMEYAVYNLLTNAVKYSPPNTRVTGLWRRWKGRSRASLNRRSGNRNG